MTWREHATDEQQAAISCPSTNCCVVAGPGTGKTTTLLLKALQLIEEEQAPARRIRIVNFTNDGKLDLKRQIRKKEYLSGVDPAAISTFHSLALGALASAHAPSVRQPAKILDDWQESTFLDRFVKAQLGLTSVTKAEKLREDYGSRWCLTTEDEVNWHPDESTRRAYEAAFLDVKRLLSCLTRSELTYLWWQHLRSNPTIEKDELGIDADWLLVDEYQDLNECEHDIIAMLVGLGVHVYAVGDPNQAIYESLRHAHPRYCIEFTERVPDSARHLLDRSHRCPSSVLKYGAALLNFADGIPDPEKASRAGDAHILSFKSSEREEADVALLAEHLLAANPKARILLALPTKKLAPAFERALSAVVEVEDRTKAKKDDDYSCRLAEAFQRLLKQPEDGVAAASAIVLMGAQSKIDQHARDLLILAHERGQRVSDVLWKGDALPGTLGKAADRAREALQALGECEDVSAKIQELTGCEKALVDPSGIAEVSDENPAALEPGRVTIMTLHKSKGLEAEHVILPVVEPDNYERKAVGSGLDERRRLLYVGMTRAVDSLYLTFATRRRGATRYAGAGNQSMYKHQSQFIDEICNRLNIRPDDGHQFVTGLVH